MDFLPKNLWIILKHMLPQCGPPLTHGLGLLLWANGRLQADGHWPRKLGSNGVNRRRIFRGHKQQFWPPGCLVCWIRACWTWRTQLTHGLDLILAVGLLFWPDGHRVALFWLTMFVVGLGRFLVGLREFDWLWSRTQRLRGRTQGCQLLNLGPKRGVLMNQLKYGFYKKSLRKDAPLTSWTLFSSLFFQISTDIWKKSEEKSVQLVWGASFRVDFLQNPYFTLFFPNPISWVVLEVEGLLFETPWAPGSTCRSIEHFSKTKILTNRSGGKWASCFQVCSKF